MTAVALVLCAMAVALALRPDLTGAQRLARLTPRPASRRGAMTATAACFVAGGALALVVGGVGGLVVGLAAAVAGPMALSRLEPAAVRRERDALVAELPMLLDLLAACLAGGASLSTAAAAVSTALPGPCAGRLRAVVHTLAVGSPPGEAWFALAGGSPDDVLAPAARLLARASEGGTPVAAAVTRLAAETRAASTAAGSEPLAVSVCLSSPRWDCASCPPSYCSASFRSSSDWQHRCSARSE